MVLIERVVRRFTASLAHELETRMKALLGGGYDPKEASKLADWLETHFWFKSTKTPRGQKTLKEDVDRLWWWLKHGSMQGASPEGILASIQDAWDRVLPHVATLASQFSEEGGKSVPKELKLGSNTYLNEAGLDAKKLAEYAKRLEVVLGEVRGWRQKALSGGLTVMLASPKQFHGTAGGKYKSAEDIMMVRATPDVLKRGAGYGSFEYIIVHELGHRYERKVSMPGLDFDRPEWHTSKYSQREGESFAELFAISNFKMTGPWDHEVIEKFDRLLG